MDLLTEPWIDTTDGEKSLLDVFSDASIEDLSGIATEKIAHYRLLIAVAQAALDGPVDEEAKSALTPEVLESAVRGYLQNHTHVFQSETFLQLPNFTSENAKGEPMPQPLTNLVEMTERKRGSGFRAVDRQTLTEAEIMRRIVTLQNYAPSGLIRKVRNWGGVKDMQVSSKYPPCLQSSAYHAFVLCDSLRETVIANLVSRAWLSDRHPHMSWGLPVWEQYPEGPETVDAEAFQNGTQTYLGRLVPLSRAIRRDGDQMFYSEAWVYPELPFRELSTSLYTGKKNETLLVRVSEQRETWRELPAILAANLAEGQGTGPECLVALRGLNEDVTVWMGGFAFMQNPLRMTETRVRVKSQMLETLLTNYQYGLDFAREYLNNHLSSAIGVYTSEWEGPQHKIDINAVRSDYWANLCLGWVTLWEESDQALLSVCESRPSKPVVKSVTRPDICNLAWGKHCLGVARQLLRKHCPASKSMHLRALAKAERRLHVIPLSTSSKSTSR